MNSFYLDPSLLLLAILILSIYLYISHRWINQTGSGCGIPDGITNSHSVNIFNKNNDLPFPQFRKYWYRNYGEMTDPFYTNYWKTYWDDSDYFSDNTN